MNTSEVLNRAADLIQERGCSNSYSGPGLCLETALTTAMSLGAGPNSWPIANTCPAGVAVRDYLGLGEWGHRSAGSLWIWNDTHSAAEVIEVLRATAVIEAAREEQDAAWETYAEQVTA